VEYHSLRYVNTSILFGKKEELLPGGRSLLSYKFKRREIKQTILIIEACLHYKRAELYPLSFKVKFIYR
jgi:hypothetical protein